MKNMKAFTYKPFLSFTTLRIVALIIFGITNLLLATYLLMYTSVIPESSLNPDNASNIFDIFIGLFVSGDLIDAASDYAELISLKDAVMTIYYGVRLVPLLMTIGLFGKLVQKRVNVKRIFIDYVCLSIIFYIFEITMYYTMLEPMVDTVMDAENITQSTKDLCYDLISMITRAYANVNMFIDLAACVVFYKFFMLRPKKDFFKKHMRIYRGLSLVPLVFVIMSMVLQGLERKYILDMPFALGAMLSSHGIYVYLVFIFLCVFYKYMYKKEKEEFFYYPDEGIGLFFYNSYLIIFIIIVSIVSRILGMFDSLRDFGLGYGRSYYLVSPLIVFYNHKIRARFRFLKLIYFMYYMVLFLILFGMYSEILDYIHLVIKALASS
ncbi:MAG: hypothetical protein K6G48_01205 [Acholeplasmatales bacterium]|nr:hypothetical protein [Acholeplasmatales bacterium]